MGNQMKSRVITALLQVFVVYTPIMQEIFGFTSIGLIDWVKILLFSSMGLLVFPEFFIKRKRSNNHSKKSNKESDKTTFK